jgi:hypothetical protein
MSGLSILHDNSLVSGSLKLATGGEVLRCAASLIILLEIGSL